MISKIEYELCEFDIQGKEAILKSTTHQKMHWKLNVRSPGNITKHITWNTLEWKTRSVEKRAQWINKKGLNKLLSENICLLFDISVKLISIQRFDHW